MLTTEQEMLLHINILIDPEDSARERLVLELNEKLKREAQIKEKDATQKSSTH